MSKDNKFFDDLYKLSGSAMNMAFGTAVEAKKQFDDMINSKIDDVLLDRGYVAREEFLSVKKNLQGALDRIEKLEKSQKKDKK